jgi:hypothetical protein
MQLSFAPLFLHRMRTCLNIGFYPVQGGYSQNFLRQILKIFIILGLNILRFYGPKVFFKANISKV